MNILTQNYINYKKTGKSLYFRADLHLIGGCNFKCIMCDNWKREVEINFTHDDLLKVILDLKKYYNCNYIRFHGQEPTMYQKLEELLVFAKKLKMKTSIKTNAWLLNDKRLTKIIPFLDELYLSIDGPNKEIHDEIRGIKGSFFKNISVIKKSRLIKPELKIYINSVVMNKNFKFLDKMLDFGKHYNLDRVSFVFLNDKNRKDINSLNLTKKDFFYFFQNTIPLIYEKSNYFNISVDFSPFLSNLVGKDNNFIINELKNHFSTYKEEINSFYEGIYGKYFYDKYGCFGPLDHASINFNGDMFGCCVVERDSSNSIGNIIKKDLKTLWQKEKYTDYRAKSNTTCSYASKCASNFYSRKNLFKEIYLDDVLYPKNSAKNYYRYLKEFYFEDKNIKDEIKLKKFKNILLFFFDNLDFYKKLIVEKGIKRDDIENINNLDFVKKLPILNKEILKQNYKEIEKLSNGNNFLKGKTSGESNDSFNFFYPLDFKRYVKQISIFSIESDFTFNDFYFCVTPRSCNQTIINNLKEPDYVKKIYINIDKFDFDKKQFLEINKIFLENKSVGYIHTDPKYLFYLYLGFKKYNIIFPQFKAVFSTYTYLNKSLKLFLEKNLNTKVYDNYGCSETGPIGIDFDGKEIFEDNILLDTDNSNILLSDLDNYLFPFIRYKNGDLGEIIDNKLNIYGKTSQIYYGKNLNEIDLFFYNLFPNILIYQFENNTIFYHSLLDIDEKKLNTQLKKFFGVNLKINKIGEGEFLTLGTCSKFKTII